MPVRKGAAGIAACRSEPEDRPSFVSGAYQPPSRQGFPAPSSGLRCARTRTTPIGVDRVQQVELLERRTSDRRARGLLAPSRLVERARSPEFVW